MAEDKYLESFYGIASDGKQLPKERIPQYEEMLKANAGVTESETVEVVEEETPETETTTEEPKEEEVVEEEVEEVVEEESATAKELEEFIKEEKLEEETPLKQLRLFAQTKDVKGFDKKNQAQLKKELNL